jgi:signal transduction histidine kinase/CheY-like chemotaxis protein
MKLSTRIILIATLNICGFGALGVVSYVASSKMRGLHEADNLLRDGVSALHRSQHYTSALLSTEELEKDFALWKRSWAELSDSIEWLRNSRVIGELVSSENQMVALGKVLSYWESTTSRLAELEEVLDRWIAATGASRDGILLLYHENPTPSTFEARKMAYTALEQLKHVFEAQFTALSRDVASAIEREYQFISLRSFLFGGLIGVVVLLVLGNILMSLRRQFEVIHRSMTRIGQGDFSVKLPEEGDDELRLISVDINRTTNALERQSTELTKLNETLESEVARRTNELRNTVEQLERESQIRLQTEKSLLESEIKYRHLQKMDALGAFAGGMAHDFNNILAAIVGYAEIAREQLPETSQVYGDLQEIMAAGGRAKELVSQILTFSRQGEQELQPVKIQAVVREASRMLHSVIPSTIDIEEIIDEDCGAILADPTQIHQIVVNLCTNAYHAVGDEEGVIGVQVQQVMQASKSVDAHSEHEPLPYAELRVTDTGHGIPPEIQDKVFDPYFTTKAKGKGTGLGLAVTHSIVRSFGGEIEVVSDIDKGTVFSVRFPIVQPRQSKEVDVARATPQGHERILMVDDDKSALGVLTKYLRRIGHHVTPVDDSIEAWTLFQTDHSQFDLVITDMTMPHMTGAALARRILELRPSMPVILCTGYSKIINAESARTMGIREFVTKPLDLHSFGQTIRTVLDGS